MSSQVGFGNMPCPNVGSVCNGAIFWCNREGKGATALPVTDRHLDAVCADRHARANSHRDPFAHAVSLADGITCPSHCDRGASDRNAPTHCNGVADAVVGFSHGYSGTADRCSFTYQSSVADESASVPHEYQVASGEGAVEHNDNRTNGNRQGNGYQHHYHYRYRHDHTDQNAHRHTYGHDVSHDCANNTAEAGRENVNACYDRERAAHGRTFISPNTCAARDGRTNCDTGKVAYFDSWAEQRGFAGDRSVAALAPQGARIIQE